jgi:hypothetical protein
MDKPKNNNNDNAAPTADNPPVLTPFPSARQASGQPEFTHKAWAYEPNSEGSGVYLECGVSRLPPCPDCGAVSGGDAKVFLNRVPVTGFNGAILVRVKDELPPQVEPVQTEFDGAVLLPGT